MANLRNQSGYTIIELLISIAVSSILSTVLLGITLHYFGSVIRSQVNSEMAVSSHYTLRAIVEDLRVATSLGTTGVLPDSNAQSGGWSTNSASQTLLINRPATDASDNIVYDSSTGNPYSNEFVYFVQDSKLFRRSITNSAASGNTTVTSCPVSLPAAGCPPDRTYADHVSSFTFTMYDQDGNITTDPGLAQLVDVELAMERRVFGEDVTLTNKISTALRNRQ